MALTVLSFWICLRILRILKVSFTWYHGESPSNHHLGVYNVSFSKYLIRKSKSYWDLRNSISHSMTRGWQFSESDKFRCHVQLGKFDPHRIHVWYIYLHINCHKHQLNVGKYTIHGSYGIYQTMMMGLQDGFGHQSQDGANGAPYNK